MVKNKRNPPIQDDLPDEDLPFNGPDLYYPYHCLSCEHVDWVEYIVAFAFPPEKPGECCVLVCPECQKTFKHNKNIPYVESYEPPEHPPK